MTLGDRELDELMFPQEAILKLASMGITTLNQLLKLPRAGISKRFGCPLYTSDAADKEDIVDVGGHGRNTKT